MRCASALSHREPDASGRCRQRAQSRGSPARGPRTEHAHSAGGRGQIPRLQIDLPIAEGDLARDVGQGKTPEGFAFHLPGTSILGIAQLGDQVLVSTPDLRALTYVITDVHPRVSPEDASWVQPTAAERLTLQTSTGPNPPDPRVVVSRCPHRHPDLNA
jgi:sortase (surface protein transpeptidase)